MTRKIAPRWLTADSPSFLLLNLLTSTFIRASGVTWWPHTILQVAHWVFILNSHTNKHSNCFSINSDEEQPCWYSDYYFCIIEACLKFVCRLATWFDPKECAAWQQVLLTFIHLGSRCVGSVACRDAEPGSDPPHNVDVFSFNWFDLVLILAFRWVSPLSLNKTSPLLFFPSTIFYSLGKHLNYWCHSRRNFPLYALSLLNVIVSRCLCDKRFLPACTLVSYARPSVRLLPLNLSFLYCCFLFFFLCSWTL